MSARRYLPSTQFTLLVVSVALSAGLVYAADLTTRPLPPGKITSAVDSSNAVATLQHDNWEATLNAIQAQQGSSTLPTSPDESTVEALRKAAQNNNLTDTVSRNLLINLSSAAAQGQGGDAGTQNAIVQDALSQISQPIPAKTYTVSDLLVVPDSADALRTYGNAIIVVLQEHQSASEGQTFQIIGNAINGSPSELPKLDAIGKDYRALAKDLADVPVPQLLEISHLQIINDFERMGGTYPALQAVQSDPLRALSGLQQYNALGGDAQNMFINIAQAFGKNGILFTKDEPGGSWFSLLSPQ